MKKPRRPRRAKNKIADPTDGTLIKVDPPVLDLTTSALHRSDTVVTVRSTLLSAELEEVIDLIARDRVYRMMLASLRRRLLAAPALPGDA